MKTRVYVAGPYTKPDPGDNTLKAIAIGNKLLDLGYVPFVPHLTHYWDLEHKRPYDEWLDYDNQWLPHCHVVLRLPGESSGADKEVAYAKSLGIPVHYSMTELTAHTPANQPDRGDPEFKKLLDQCWELHCKKNADYGTKQDTFANYRSAEDFGFPAYVSTVLRLGEKMNRIKAYFRNGKLENEGIEDTLMDMATISLITLVLLRKAT